MNGPTAKAGAGRKIAGVVLAGGRSQRFGRDKALALLGGQPLIHWSLQALRPGAEVLAISGPPALGRLHHLPWIADLDGAPPGPLAGIVGALSWARDGGFSHVLTAPCDTPFLPSDMARMLIDAICDHRVAAARAERVHGLCALWRVDLAPVLSPIALQADQPPLQRIIGDLDGALVDFPDEAAFVNLNTPTDFLGAEQRWASRQAEETS